MAILHIKGVFATGRDKIGYRLADAGDLNADGVHDLLVSSTAGMSPKGAVWAFLMPSLDEINHIDVWSWLQQRGPSADAVVRDPIEITADDYSIEVLGTDKTLEPKIGHIGTEEITGVSDLDGDGASEFVVTAPNADVDLDGDGALEANAGKVLLFLSGNRLHRSFRSLQSRLRIADFNAADPSAALTTAVDPANPDAYVLDLDPLAADIVFVGELGVTGFGKDISEAGHIERPAATACVNPPYAVYPDLDGDCRADIAVARKYPPSGSSDTMWVFLDVGQYVDHGAVSPVIVSAANDANASLPPLVNAGSSVPSDWLIGVHTAGDVDGDGDDELIVYQRLSGEAVVLDYRDLDGAPGGPGELQEIVRIVPEDVDLGEVSTGKTTEDALYFNQNSRPWSTHLSRFWPVWDLDGDGRDDLNVTAWMYPKVLEGVASQADHEAVPDHPVAMLPPHDPIVRAGKSYIFLSAPKSVVTAIQATPSNVLAPGESATLEILGDNLLWPWGRDEFDIGDVMLEPAINLLGIPPELSGIPVTTLASGKPDRGVRISGITVDVPSNASAGVYDLRLRTRRGVVVYPDAIEVTGGAGGGTQSPMRHGSRNLASRLLGLLAQWGHVGKSEYDLTGDGVVDAADLLHVLGQPTGTGK